MVATPNEMAGPTTKALPDNEPKQASVHALKTVEPNPVPAGIVTPHRNRSVERYATARDSTLDTADASSTAVETANAQSKTKLTAPAIDFGFQDDRPGRELRFPVDEPSAHVTATEPKDMRRTTDAPNTRVEPVVRSVLTQIVSVARTAVDGAIEVKLSPEELGRVRLSMTGAENGMTVQVTAERPETLDLIRRNIELFASDLLEQGFQNLSFSFGDDQANDSGKDNGKITDHETHGIVDPHGMDITVALDVPLDGRLDIRL